MNKRDSPFTIHGFHTSILHDNDSGKLQELLKRCTDYCMLVDGHPPRPSAAASLLTERPEGKPLDDKVVIGLFTLDKTMIGVLDTLRNYPAKDDWWIGLMLIDPAYRNRGLGKQVVQSFEKWSSLQGARRIFLGVVERNEKALRFWQSIGYQVVERQPPTKFGNLTHIVNKMVHILPRVEND